MKHYQLIKVLLPDVRHEICKTQLDVLFANLSTGAFPSIQLPVAGNRTLAKIKLADFCCQTGLLDDHESGGKNST
jgi:hypothetical protein